MVTNWTAAVVTQYHTSMGSCCLVFNCTSPFHIHNCCWPLLHEPFRACMSVALKSLASTWVPCALGVSIAGKCTSAPSLFDSVGRLFWAPERTLFDFLLLPVRLLTSEVATSSSSSMPEKSCVVWNFYLPFPLPPTLEPFNIWIWQWQFLSTPCFWPFVTSCGLLLVPFAMFSVATFFDLLVTLFPFTFSLPLTHTLTHTHLHTHTHTHTHTQECTRIGCKSSRNNFIDSHVQHLSAPPSFFHVPIKRTTYTP